MHVCVSKWFNKLSMVFIFSHGVSHGIPFPDGYMGYVNNGTERTNDEYKYKLQYLSFSFPMVGNAA